MSRELPLFREHQGRHRYATNFKILVGKVSAERSSKSSPIVRDQDTVGHYGRVENTRRLLRHNAIRLDSQNIECFMYQQAALHIVDALRPGASSRRVVTGVAARVDPYV